VRIFAQRVIVYLGQLFLKITEVAHIFGFFFPRLRLRINFEQKALGDILGEFFTN
jgi:hypothetical protein